MKLCAIMSVMLCGVIGIAAQSDPKPIPTPEFKDSREEDFQRRMRDMDKAVRDMRMRAGVGTEKLTKEEARRVNELITPDSDDINKYKNFLKRKRTGIFRLFEDLGCESRFTIRVDGDCSAAVPGKWAYSFRQRNYSDGNFHDIGFRGDMLFSVSLLSQAIVVRLADDELEKVSLLTDGTAFLTNFVPAGERQSINRQYREISEGIQQDGFQYSNQSVVAEGATHALRIIAYRFTDKDFSRFSRRNAPNLTPTAQDFQMLRYDERNDSIFAFRIIRVGDDGGITILWKQLSRKRSPAIVFEKDQELLDFRY